VPLAVKDGVADKQGVSTSATTAPAGDEVAVGGGGAADPEPVLQPAPRIAMTKINTAGVLRFPRIRWRLWKSVFTQAEATRARPMRGSTEESSGVTCHRVISTIDHRASAVEPLTQASRRRQPTRTPAAMNALRVEPEPSATIERYPHQISTRPITSAT
jgi:hypothetical protein